MVNKYTPHINFTKIMYDISFGNLNKAVIEKLNSANGNGTTKLYTSHEDKYGEIWSLTSSNNQCIRGCILIPGT